MPSFSNRPDQGDASTQETHALGSGQNQLRIAAFIEDLKDSTWQVRCQAATGLERIGPDARDAVPALAQALKDSNADVRYHVACALGKIGPAARDAVPALVQALKDVSDGVRSAAAEALPRIFPQD